LQKQIKKFSTFMEVFCSFFNSPIAILTWIALSLWPLWQRPRHRGPRAETEAWKLEAEARLGFWNFFRGETEVLVGLETGAPSLMTIDSLAN
jgi:hypothetical protein